MAAANASGCGDHAEDDQKGAVLHVWQTDQPFSGMRLVKGSGQFCQKGVRSRQVGHAVERVGGRVRKGTCGSC